ncbi:MAG: hypothetical protein FVQ78_00660 [Solirubrobacterales bacterium]|nr:hypothetical protein [Solirubrobacterales bacterium]
MAESWAGFEVGELGGAGVGRVHSFFADAGSGEPAWLIAALGRRRAKLVAIPLRDCAAAAGRVWCAHDREALRTAPAVDPTRPLLREHELAICAHYGIGERVGRAAEVHGRPEGSVTSQPAA